MRFVCTPFPSQHPKFNKEIRMKKTSNSKTTKDPITVSGWYEHTDGTVGHYSWRSGKVVHGGTVADWGATRPTNDELRALRVACAKKGDAVGIQICDLALDGCKPAITQAALAIAEDIGAA